MPKFICVPLENLPQRYTIMMNQKIENKFDHFLYPEIELGGIQNGEFLDIIQTIKFKSRQLEMIADLFDSGEVQDGDVFFISDIFFPGIESIRYMSELLGIDVKIFAINHAGRADENDFVQKLGEWSDSSELGYHQICDGIFVGSEFHKNNIVKHFNIHPDKIHVTGMIWDLNYMNSYLPDGNTEKEDYIIWPHRVSPEKGIYELLTLAENTNKTIYVTSGGKINFDFNSYDNIKVFENLTKIEYYDIFRKAKYYLSNSIQETFGYTIQEAIFFRCGIIAPNRNATVEMLPSECLYSEIDELIYMVNNDQFTIPEFHYTTRWESSFNRMIEIIEGSI